MVDLFERHGFHTEKGDQARVKDASKACKLADFEVSYALAERSISGRGAPFVGCVLR